MDMRLHLAFVVSTLIMLPAQADAPRSADTTEIIRFTSESTDFWYTGGCTAAYSGTTVLITRSSSGYEAFATEETSELTHVLHATSEPSGSVIWGVDDDYHACDNSPWSEEINHFSVAEFSCETGSATFTVGTLLGMVITFSGSGSCQVL